MVAQFKELQLSVNGFRGLGHLMAVGRHQQVFSNCQARKKGVLIKDGGDIASERRRPLIHGTALEIGQARQWLLLPAQGSCDS